MRRTSSLTLVSLAAFCLAVLAEPRAFADSNPYDTVTPYDLADLGLPQFIGSTYIDLAKVNDITKFRSDDGHDYSDLLEFGSQAINDPNTGKPETCRSMKHYFYGVQGDSAIYSPVDGTVTSSDVNDDGASVSDYQVGIEPDAQPAFGINIFHVVLDQPLTVGQHLTAGQRLGHHPDPSIFPANDIAVFVKTTQGFHLVSYFDVLTQGAMAPFTARGITSAAELEHTAAEIDAHPYQCTQAGNPPVFINVTVDPSLDFVALPGGAATQTLLFQPYPLPVTASLYGGPITVTPSASSGLPVTLSSNTPAICTTSGNSIVPVATGECLVTFTQAGNPNLYATSLEAFTIITAGLNAGSIYSSAQANTQSFLRFYNSGTAAGTVTATLSDSVSGTALATWTSPSIPAGSEQQFPISTLEAALAPGTTKPSTYSMLVQTSMTGTFQNVLYSAADATLTNLSTCALGVVSVNPAILTGVHSSVLEKAGYPSAIVVNNTGSAATAAVLDMYDARDGTKLGSYTTAPIAAGAKQILDVGVMESAANIVPTAAMLHYVVKLETGFPGFLQHLVTNQKSNIVTDMTASCTLDGSVPGNGPQPLHPGLIYSSAQPASQSFLRFFNEWGQPAGTVTVTLSDYQTGKTLTQWTSTSIPPGAEQQVSIASLESGITGAKPAYYAVAIQSTFFGYFQHVLWHQADGTLTNLSTCDYGTGVEVPLTLTGVHSSLLGAAGYPSTIVITNNSSVPVTFPLYVYDARNGTYLGIFYNTPVPGNGSQLLDIPTIEAAVGIKPTGTMYHYNIDAFIFLGSVGNGSRAQPGYFQHLVNNQAAGVITDMTTTCLLN